MKRVFGTCKICLGKTWRNGRPEPFFHCRLSAVEPTEDCWDLHHGKAGQVCMDSLLVRRWTEEQRNRRDSIIRELMPIMEAGEIRLREYLCKLSPEERGELLSFSAPRLRLILQQLMAGPEKMDCVMPVAKVLLPEELPSELKKDLEGYLQRIRNRYERMIANGHRRSPMYLRNKMKAPIRLALFLNDSGVQRWDVMTKQHLTRFFIANPKVTIKELKSFLNFIAKKKVFKDNRGNRYGTRNAFVEDKTPPKVLPPEALNQYLKNQKEILTDTEYLAVWLVAKMGMMAGYAYDFTMDRITIDDNGSLVIKPAEIWIKPPKSIATMFVDVARKTSNRWPFKPLERGTGVNLFHPHLNRKQYFDIIAGKARLLRASAIYAAMLKGNLDRVTIHETMGVSIPTIIKMETLLSSDLHHVCDSELVKLRNDYILGKKDG